MKLSLKIVWKTKITFLLSEKLPFFINKNIFYSWRYILFKIPKNLIASLLFPKETFRLWNMKYRLQRWNQIGLYESLIKRWIFDDSDETEIRLPLLNCLNILKYTWWLLNSGFRDFKRRLTIVFNNFES